MISEHVSRVQRSERTREHRYLTHDLSPVKSGRKKGLIDITVFDLREYSVRS
jgi:hypothetical protein